MSQPRQSNRHLLFITRAYAISNDIDPVSGPEEIECGLSDTDVALDADNDAGEWSGGVERV